MKNLNIFFCTLAFAGVMCAATQTSNIDVRSTSELTKVLDTLISKKLYKDLNRELKLFFVLKVDSMGEIHSAHISRSENLVVSPLYLSFGLCIDIENRIKAKFLYDTIKSTIEHTTNMPCYDKYIRLTYVYKGSIQKGNGSDILKEDKYNTSLQN